MQSRVLHAAPMAAQISDGKALSAKVKAGLKTEVEALKAKYGRAPGIASLLGLLYSVLQAQPMRLTVGHRDAAVIGVRPLEAVQ